MNFHKTYRLQRKMVLPVSLEESWSFFSDPRNLSEITPPSLRLALTCTAPPKMYAGMILSYRVSPFLLPIEWLTEITHVRAPHYFVDEQRSGPYRMWHHQHFFREVEGGVEVEDIVDYILPFGPLGTLLHRLLVQQKLDHIFDFRSRVLAERFVMSVGSERLAQD